MTYGSLFGKKQKKDINMKTKEKPSMIIERKKPYIHCELHYKDHVDFVTLDGTYIGTSTVEPYEP